MTDGAADRTATPSRNIKLQIPRRQATVTSEEQESEPQVLTPNSDGQDEASHENAIHGPSYPEELGPAMVRIHSECYTGETVWSARCDCGEQLDEAARLMSLPAPTPGSTPASEIT